MTQTLTASFDRPISSRARLLAPAGLAATLLFGRNLSRTGAQDAPDAEALLKQAAETMASLDSFRFALTTDNGQTQFMEGITLNSVTGIVKRPDRFYAEAEVDAILATITIKMISIGGVVWVTDPLARTESYTQIGAVDFGSLDPTALINPDRIILPALKAVSSPVIAGTESLDGVETTRLDGTVSLSAAIDTAATPTPGDSPLRLPESMPFSAWIDADHYVRRIELTGAILENENSDIIRRIDFSGFNESVDIQAPNQ